MYGQSELLYCTCGRTCYGVSGDSCSHENEINYAAKQRKFWAQLYAANRVREAEEKAAALKAAEDAVAQAIAAKKAHKAEHKAERIRKLRAFFSFFMCCCKGQVESRNESYV